MLSFQVITWLKDKTKLSVHSQQKSEDPAVSTSANPNSNVLCGATDVSQSSSAQRTTTMPDDTMA